MAANLRNNIAGFSSNMRAVVERFDFDNTISKLDEAGLLFQVLERFRTLDLHPDKVDNPTMGTIFEELIRRFNEALDENPGEHFTPPDVVHLMVDLMLAGDEERIAGCEEDRLRKVGLVGYEINFNRYFYRFRPPRPLGEIEADIRRIEGEMVAMLREVAGGVSEQRAATGSSASG